MSSTERKRAPGCQCRCVGAHKLPKGRVAALRDAWSPESGSSTALRHESLDTGSYGHVIKVSDGCCCGVHRQFWIPEYTPTRMQNVARSCEM
eukprot:160629-Rhodomonas_salina.2